MKSSSSALEAPQVQNSSLKKEYTRQSLMKKMSSMFKNNSLQMIKALLIKILLRWTVAVGMKRELKSMFLLAIPIQEERLKLSIKCKKTQTGHLVLVQSLHRVHKISDKKIIFRKEVLYTKETHLIFKTTCSNQVRQTKN